MSKQVVDASQQVESREMPRGSEANRAGIVVLASLFSIVVGCVPVFSPDAEDRGTGGEKPALLARATVPASLRAVMGTVYGIDINTITDARADNVILNRLNEIATFEETGEGTDVAFTSPSGAVSGTGEILHITETIDEDGQELIVFEVALTSATVSVSTDIDLDMVAMIRGYVHTWNSTALAVDLEFYGADTETLVLPTLRQLVLPSKPSEEVDSFMAAKTLTQSSFLYMTIIDPQITQDVCKCDAKGGGCTKAKCDSQHACSGNVGGTCEWRPQYGGPGPGLLLFAGLLLYLLLWCSKDQRDRA